MGVKNNKRQGAQAEAEIEAIIDERFPDYFWMARTGQDGGHDLTGKRSIGEVKRVKNGPEWLKELLRQWVDADRPHHFGFVKLAGGNVGQAPRWLAILDLEELIGYLTCYAQVSSAPLDGRGATHSLLEGRESGRPDRSDPADLPEVRGDSDERVRDPLDLGG